MSLRDASNHLNAALRCIPTCPFRHLFTWVALAGLPFSLAAPVGQSEWFTLNLRAAGSAFTQTFSPEEKNAVAFTGNLGPQRDILEFQLDFAEYTFNPASTYVCEFQLDTKSTTDWPEIVSNGNHSVAWRASVDPVEKRLRIDATTTVGVYTLQSSPAEQWVWPADSSQFTHPFPADSWPAARYRYVLIEKGASESTEIATGSFLLSKLINRHSGSSTEQPVILLHGIGSDASFFADADWRDSVFDDDFDGPNSLGGRFASSRATYTLEMPNTGDIATNAYLLNGALEKVTQTHSTPQVDAIAHGTGGLVTRYYLQHLASSFGGHIDRFVSIGSPFEGVSRDEFAYEANWSTDWDPVKNTRVGYKLEALTDMNFGPLAIALDSEAMEQLIDPGSSLAAFGHPLWKNDAPQVSEDSDFLPVLGSNQTLIELAQGDIPGILSSPSKKEILAAALSFQSEHLGSAALQSRSDAITSWNSGGKRPASQKNALYVRSNHTGYNSLRNKDRSQMLDGIESFFAGASLSGNTLFRTSPSAVPDEIIVSNSNRKALTILSADGQRISDAYLYVATDDSQSAAIISTLSGTDGVLLAPASLQVSANSNLVISAPGFQDSAITSLPSDSSAFSFANSYILQRDDSYQSPILAALKINNGAAQTDSLTVALEINAENATEMSLSDDPGLLSWQPFAFSSSHTFTASDPGEKTIYAAFRNSEGSTGPIAFDSIVYSPDAAISGTLEIRDKVGGSAVYINGEKISQTTPATLQKMPVGRYTVSLFKEGIDFQDEAYTISLLENEVRELVFQRAASTEVSGFQEWLAESLPASQLGNPFYTGENADGDGDSRGNLFEYIANIDPADITSRFEIHFPDDSGNTLIFGPTQSDVSYSLKYSFNMIDWDTLSPTLLVPSAGNIEADISAIGTTAFYRVEISRTLPQSGLDEMSLIPDGDFTMGSPVTENNRMQNETQHLVFLTKTFQMRRTEITNSEMADLLQWSYENNYIAANDSGASLGSKVLINFDVNLNRIVFSSGQFLAQSDFGAHPVTGVTWYGAAAYAHFLSVKEGRESGLDTDDWTFDFTKSGYRLPTEAEWEYACRAGTTTAFYSGNNLSLDCNVDTALAPVAWYCANSSNSTNVGGLKTENAWGLSDMHGNVAEWCWDFFSLDLGNEIVLNPIGGDTCHEKVVKGGSFDSRVQNCRAAFRRPVSSDRASPQIGFRIIRVDPEIATAAMHFTEQKGGE